MKRSSNTSNNTHSAHVGHPGHPGHPGRDTVLGFVLGTLETDEGTAFEEHVTGCAACARALAAEAAREQSLWSSWLAITDGTDAKPLAPVIPLTLALSPGSSRAAGSAPPAAASAIQTPAVSIAGTGPASAMAKDSPGEADALLATAGRDHAVVARRGFAAGWASGVAAAALIGIFAGRGGLSYEPGSLGGVDGGLSRVIDEAVMCGDVVAGEPLCRSPRALRAMLVSLSPDRDEPAVCTATAGGQPSSCEAPSPVLASHAIASPATADSFAASFMSFPAAPMSRAE
jgi:hypothetical protein